MTEVKKSYADVLTGITRPKLVFVKNGKIVGDRIYGPRVINTAKNNDVKVIPATVQSPDTPTAIDEETYCIIC